MANSKKNSKNQKILITVIAVILVIIIVTAIVLYFVKPSIYHKLLGTGEHTWSEWETVEPTCGADGKKTRTCTVCGDTDIVPIPATGNHDYDEDEVCKVCGFDNKTPSVEVVSNSTLSIHFLELGNKNTGDCVLIKCGDTEVLIDAGSKQNSAPALKTYIDQYCTDNVLEYVIATHSDEDHISGFFGSKSGDTRTGLLYQYEVETIIHFDNTTHSEYTDKGNLTLYGQFLEAVNYCKDTYDTAVYTASQCYDQSIDGAKRQYFLDDSQKISLNILYNYYYYNSSKDNNEHSVVTLLTEETEAGKRNYLFTGDLEGDGESRMVDYYKSVPADCKSDYNVLPEVELFKAGHHGSGTSSTEKLLKVIKPKNVAICCCCGAPEYTLDPANVFPYNVTVKRLMDFTENIYITSLAVNVPPIGTNGKYPEKEWDAVSMNGNIVFYSTGANLKHWCSNNDTVLKDTEWYQENRG